MAMSAAALRKGYGMMGNWYLAAMVEAKQGDSFFYRSQVNAEFTKNLTHFCKVVIDRDGIIAEATCECVAGSGVVAGCKHLAVTCYSILNFKEEGTWIVRKTCTEQPQKWHMPKRKKIQVSPQKVQQLSFSVPIYKVEKKKIGNLCYDPRPPEYCNMPGYNDSVRNAILNYRSCDNRRPFGITGVYEASNISALCNDHDYLARPLQHQWVYNRIQVYASEAESIEKRTRTQSKSQEWHEIRSFLITASNVGDIVKMTDRRNKNKYADGLVTPTVFSTAAVTWGKGHEKTAIAEYEKKSLNQVQPCGFFISKEYPFIGGSPDGLIRVLTVLEVKCPYSIRDECISENNVQYLELENGELQLKKSSNYYFQIQTQLLVTGRLYYDFIVWTKNDFKRLSVERDDNVINNVIIPKVKHFYEEHMAPAIVRRFNPL